MAPSTFDLAYVTESAARGFAERARLYSLASHHDQHHKRSRYWYGAAFPFWDRAMKTAAPEEKPPEELKKSA